MTDELRNKFRQEITKRFDDFKLRFKEGRESYLTSINNLLDAIHVSFVSGCSLFLRKCEALFLPNILTKNIALCIEIGLWWPWSATYQLRWFCARFEPIILYWSYGEEWMKSSISFIHESSSPCYDFKLTKRESCYLRVMVSICIVIGCCQNMTFAPLLVLGQKLEP